MSGVKGPKNMDHSRLQDIGQSIACQEGAQDGRPYDSWLVVDTHCHLDRYEDPDAVVERAVRAGVRAMVAISTCPDNFAKVLPIAQRWTEVWACAGVHPCDATPALIQHLAYVYGSTHPQRGFLDPQPQSLYQQDPHSISVCGMVGTKDVGKDQVNQEATWGREDPKQPLTQKNVSHSISSHNRHHQSCLDTPQDPDPHNGLLVQEADALAYVYDWLVHSATDPKVIGLGETGLDCFHSKDPHVLARQEQFFAVHIRAAQDTGLPLVVHTRHSDDLFLHTMSKAFDRARAEGRPLARGVLHCFTGSTACAVQAASWGWKVSLSGILTFGSAGDVRAMAAALPVDALLVETDAPWLAPAAYRGQRNEPAYVRETLQMLAQVRGCTPDEMAAQTTSNFCQLFTKARL